MAECKGNVELKEELQEVPCLGYRNAITRRFATLLVTFKHKVKKVDIKNLELISFKGEFIDANGDSVILSFTRCLPMEELDLTEKGINKFEVICSPEIINKLLAI